MKDTIRNAHGERIDYTFTPGRDDQRLVVIGHGVTANKDRPWAVTLAAALEGAGFPTLRITFSGNGDSEGDFRDSNVTKEVADLGAVLDACEAAGHTEVCYAGHSMGAAVGVIRASEDRRITCLVSLGGMVDTADFCTRKFGELTPGRDVMWDREDCPLSQAYVDDLTDIGSLAERGASIEVPFLLVHGTDDTVVPLHDSEAIAAHAPSAEVVALDGADHVFSDAAADTMARHVRDWLSNPSRSRKTRT